MDLSACIPNSLNLLPHSQIHINGLIKSEYKKGKINKNWFRSIITVSIIEFEIKIRRVELVETNVTIFTTTSVSLAVGMESQRVDGTEMTFNSAKFFFENQVKETGVELADTS